MVYDRDLKFMSRVILFLLAGNAFGGIEAAYRHDWVRAGAFAVWCVNIWIWRRMNQNLQRQRDRNREIEAAVVKVLIPSRLDKIN